MPDSPKLTDLPNLTPEERKMAEMAEPLTALPFHNTDEVNKRWASIAHDFIPRLLRELSAARTSKLPDKCPVCGDAGCSTCRIDLAVKRIGELESFIGDPGEHFEFLWKSYGDADPSELTGDAQALRERLRRLVGIEGLEAELAACRELEKQHAEDTARLDWLDGYICAGGIKGLTTRIDFAGPHENIRAAIDAVCGEQP